MSKSAFPAKYSLKTALSSLVLSSVIWGGCSVAAKNAENAPVQKNSQIEKTTVAAPEMKTAVRGARIKISPGSPADAIRQFYKHLREKRFREAVMMTNMRPAVEGLTDAEMNDLSGDFEAIARSVPEVLEINGEIVAGESATVTAKMPDEETGNLELKEFKLRRESEAWTILWLDEVTEKTVKKAGKNYLFALKMETHQIEAQKMMERIARSQMVYALQNNGQYADMKTLIDAAVLPADVQTPASTGYVYAIKPSPDGRKFMASAEPAVYGKTGKLSFLLDMQGKDGKPRLRAEDNKGQPLKK